MKTNLYLFKISVFTVLLLFVHINVFGTGRMSAQLKDNQTLVVDFFHTDTVLIVVPEACELSAVDKADIENAIFWENDQPRPAYIYKSESEITKKKISISTCSFMVACNNFSVNSF